MFSLNSKACYAALDLCFGADKFRLRRQLQGLISDSKKATEDDNSDVLTKKLASWMSQVEASGARRTQRKNALPKLTYPENLPVSQKREDIVELIKNNQVVILAGETGSGKTTQLPKMCLEAGQGINGYIGHTQPRRLAARSVCNRIAEELNCEVGNEVGYKVRFSDHVNQNSYIKLMTDGILLTEMQHDRFLNQYDTIIIDEAHERSLNIDFILGYLKQLLEKRKDLKVIITSATIDPQRFSKHFNNAPIVEVSGRTFPVEVRYHCAADEDFSDSEQDQLQAIFDAVDELARESMGDVLIFMNGEREIRDTADALNKRQLRDTEILPLYARLSASEQNRVFKSHRGRRIILSTNVAETSLTVPGIRYVIDPGTARISRYSYRTKVQRLPIEAVSQASANQRKGRCGRVADGICIRLYSEDDFNGRSEFTDPEILRTNLASVILQMLNLGLGSIDDFPFVQPPDSRSINDGLNLLLELGAIEQGKANNKGKRSHHKSQNQLQLTTLGKQIAKLPIDPRLARMIISAQDLGCVDELITITAALSIQDPRERPADFRQKSDQAHAKYADKSSDFMAYINLWDHIKEQQKALSVNQFRKYCHGEFLNYLRVREWQDLVAQIKQSARELKFTFNAQVSEADHIHQALLPGLLGHIGFKDNEKGYLGARNSRFHVFPGSQLFKKPPKWLMSAELVETSKLYARNNAAIDVKWVEDHAQHLVKRQYDEPHWEKKRQSVVALETQKLYGLTIVNRRRVQYGQIDPEISHELFLREGLINRQINFKAAFLDHNNALIDDIELLEEKSRRRDILVDEEDLFLFYQERIPGHVNDTVSFKRWWNKVKVKQPDLLKMDKAELMKHEAKDISQAQYPDQWQQGNITLNLEYQFEPGKKDDGINVQVPLSLLNQIEDSGFDWSIPGMRHELIVALIKSLPKSLRRNFVPAPQFADACMKAVVFDDSKPLVELVSKQLTKMSGIIIPPDSWDMSQIPSHLMPKYKVIDENAKTIAVGDDLAVLKRDLKGKLSQTLSKVAEKGIEQDGLINWPESLVLPEEYSKKRNAFEIKAYPALQDDGGSVSVKLFDNAALAKWHHQRGLARLICLNIPSPMSYLQNKLPNKSKLGLYFNPFGPVKDLIQDCIDAVINNYLIDKTETCLARNAEDFKALVDYTREQVCDSVLDIAQQVEAILTQTHQINKKLKGKCGFDMIQGQADIKSQLDKLVFKGFVVKHGVKRLNDINRYVSALERRLEKLFIDPVRDRLNRDIMEKAENDGGAYLGLFNKPQPLKQGYIELFYMLQELRVSLYAQNLGTAYPISAKRISQFIKELD